MKDAAGMMEGWLTGYMTLVLVLPSEGAVESKQGVVVHSSSSSVMVMLSGGGVSREHRIGHARVVYFYPFAARRPRVW